MNDNPSAIATKKDSVENFVALLRDVSSGLQEAAKMLGRICAEDPQAFDKIKAKAPALSDAFLANLLRVSEGTLHPQLLMGSAPAYGRIRRLPYSAQCAILKAGAVEIVVDSTSGDTLNIPVTQLEGERIGQAFTPAGVRSVEEQKAWLRRRVAPKVKKADDDDFPYFVKKNSLIVNHACELTRKQLLKLLEEMEA